MAPEISIYDISIMLFSYILETPMSFDVFTLTGIAISVALICATVSIYKKHAGEDRSRSYG